MEQVKINALNRAIQTLEALGIQYAVIDHEGTLHGNLTVAEKKSRTREGYEWGSRTKMIMPSIEGLKVGDVVTIECKEHEVESVRSIASSILGKKFGTGAYTTAIDRDKKTVEILRIA